MSEEGAVVSKTTAPSSCEMSLDHRASDLDDLIA